MVDLQSDTIYFEVSSLKKSTLVRQKENNRVKAFAAIMASAAVLFGCSEAASPQETNTVAYEIGTLNMGTGSEGSVIHQAGWKVSDIISNTVPGIYVAVEVSKGAMVNADRVSDGAMDLALIPADVAYDAVKGENSFSDKKLENLRVLGACYQEVSAWATPVSTGLTEVSELKGKIISNGSRASATELASENVFSILDIDEENTEVYTDTISASVRHLKEGTADASHAFTAVPNASHESLANEMEAVFLPYSEEQLEQILNMEPWYFETEIPAGTYQGQEEAVPTFGRKVLLCANAEMDSDLAYEIARALDLNGPVYTADTAFMSKISDKEFLCEELPIPLHEGAEDYYRELGYIRE